jgi:hypothetical protein
MAINYDFAAVHKAITGSTDVGTYDDSLVDRLRAALADLKTAKDANGVKTQLIASPSSGPFSTPATTSDDVREQLTAAWECEPGVYRTVTQMIGQFLADLAALNAGTQSATPAPPSGTTSGTSTSTLPSGTAQGVAQWKADLSKGDVIAAGYKSTSWNTEHGPAWPPPIVSQAGKRCIKFQLGSGGKRIEVEPNHRTFPKGDDAWFGFSFYLDNDFPLSADSWQVIWQLHGNDTTSPQQAIQCHKGGLSIADNHQFATVSKNQWYRVVVHAQFNSGGTMSVWLNDQNVLSNYNAGLNNPPMYLKTGLYHDMSIAGGTIYGADHALGTGYGAVRPA